MDVTCPLITPKTPLDLSAYLEPPYLYALIVCLQSVTKNKPPTEWPYLTFFISISRRFGKKLNKNIIIKKLC